MAPSTFRWTIVVGLGLAFGFMIAAAMTVLMAAQVTGDATWSTATPIWVVAIVGGAIQGVVFGVLQFALLRSWLPGLRPLPWVAVTTAVGALGWAVGIGFVLAAAINSPDDVMTVAELDERNGLNWQAAVIGIVAGAAVGLLFGLIQGHLLRRHVQHARLWIPANLVAWSAGIAFLSIGLSTPEAGWPTEFAIVVAFITFVLCGLVVAFVTGRVLLYLDDEATDRSTASEPEVST